MGLCITSLEGAYTIKDGTFCHVDDVATMSPSAHYELGMKAMDQCDWTEAARQFRIVSLEFPNSSYGPDACYYLGISYYNLDELDFANEAFSKYLKCHNNPQFFEEAISYKFDIANQFKAGAKRRFFGTKQLPKWAPGREMALEVYDEVIAAVPCHELAAWSLFAKAHLLSEDEAYRESIDVYQQLIRRFPKHELAPEAYLAISRIYIQQSLRELQNPDLIAFAQINLRRFKQDFPKEPRLGVAEENFLQLKEIYAGSIYETGQFYERKDHPKASMIYYQSAIDQFPETSTATLCKNRLKILNEYFGIPTPEEKAAIDSESSAK